MVFFAGDFLGQFQGFLITLGVPIAAWCGVMLADIALRRRDYADADLFDPRGRYGDVRVPPSSLLVVGTVARLGPGHQRRAGWLTWQGYLLGPFGLGGRTAPGRTRTSACWSRWSSASSSRSCCPRRGPRARSRRPLPGRVPALRDAA